MVDFLMRLHAGKELSLDVVIRPADIKIEVEDWLGLHEPLVFFGDVLDDGILCF